MTIGVLGAGLSLSFFPFIFCINVCACVHLWEDEEEGGGEFFSGLYWYGEDLPCLRGGEDGERGTR